MVRKLLSGVVGKAALLAASVPWLARWAIATPFKKIRPPEAGVLQEKLLLSVSCATLHRDKRAAFDEHTMRVYRSLPAQAGLVGYSIRREVFGTRVWTMTVWKDQASLMGFVMSPAHKTAISVAKNAIISMDFKRFELSRSELPLRWPAVLEMLEKARTVKKEPVTKP